MAKKYANDVVVTSSKETKEIHVDEVVLSRLMAERATWLKKIRSLQESTTRSRLAMKKMSETIAETEMISASLKDDQEVAERKMRMSQYEANRISRTIDILSGMDELEMASNMGPCGYIPYGAIYGIRYFIGQSSEPDDRVTDVIKKLDIPQNIVNKIDNLTKDVHKGTKHARALLCAVYQILCGENVCQESMDAALSLGNSTIDQWSNEAYGLQMSQMLAVIGGISESREISGKSISVKKSGRGCLYAMSKHGKKIPAGLIYDMTKSNKIILLRASITGDGS